MWRLRVAAASGITMLALLSCSSGDRATPPDASTTTAVSATTSPPTTTAATTTTVPPTTAPLVVQTTAAFTTVPATATPPPPQSTVTSTGRYVTDPTDDVRLGDSGPAVLQIQDRLIAWGYTVALDASYGLTTEAQVKAFQRDHGLTIDGICGRRTWTALSSEPPA